MFFFKRSSRIGPLLGYCMYLFVCNTCLGKPLCFSVRRGGFTGDRYFQLLAGIKNRILFWTDFCPDQFGGFMFLRLLRSKEHHWNSTAVILSNLSTVKIFVSIMLQEQFIVIFLKTVCFSKGAHNSKSKSWHPQTQWPWTYEVSSYGGFWCQVPTKASLSLLPKLDREEKVKLKVHGLR